MGLNRRYFFPNTGLYSNVAENYRLNYAKDPIKRNLTIVVGDESEFDNWFGGNKVKEIESPKPIDTENIKRGQPQEKKVSGSYYSKQNDNYSSKTGESEADKSQSEADWFQLDFTKEEIKEGKHKPFVDEFKRCRRSYKGIEGLGLYYQDTASHRRYFFPKSAERLCFDIVKRYKPERAQQPDVEDLKGAAGDDGDYMELFKGKY